MRAAYASGVKALRAFFVLLAVPVVVVGAFSCGSGGSSPPDFTPTNSGGGDGGTSTKEGGTKGEGGTSGAEGGVKDCFTLTDSKGLAFEVVQDLPPPSISTTTNDYLTTSTVYPASYFATTDITTIATPAPAGVTKLKRAYSMHANRCANITGVTPASGCTNTVITTGNSYANPAMDGTNPLLSMFSTYAKADACTTAQVSKVVGVADATISTAAMAAGITLFTGSDHTMLTTNAAKQTVTVGAAQYTYLVDLCVLETSAMASDANGVFVELDTEDLRKAADVITLLGALDKTVTGAGKELIVTSLDLTSAGARGSGVDSTNVHAEIDAVQGFGHTVGTGASSTQMPTQSATDDYTAELGVLTADGSAPLTAAEKKKILLKVNLLEDMTTVLHLDEAEALHGFVVSEGYRGVILFRNGVALGGPCDAPDNHNQVIACLTLGVCDGGFRVP
jgi:hypothetical protein